LIVDDQTNNRKLLLKLLSSISTAHSGFELREAVNGQNAIELWNEWQPHLIWMDMHMPVMDGYEATKHIRKVEIEKSRIAEDASAVLRGSESSPGFQPVSEQASSQQSTIRTVIIAVTASAFEEERAVILSAGCDDFLRKPFQDNDVFALLQKYLGVQFLYEDKDVEAQGSVAIPGARGSRPLLTPEAFAALPADMVTDLRHAVEAIDLERTSRSIDRIRQHDEQLADLLVELVDGFRFDLLQTLSEQMDS
jgi:CheY-like chemotaxis protein